MITVCYGTCAVAAGGGIHVIPQTAAELTPANRRLLRAQIPRQNVRRTKHSRRTQRLPQEGNFVPFRAFDMSNKYYLLTYMLTYFHERYSSFN